MEKVLLPISLIAEYVYCPYNCYLRLCQGIESKNAVMLRGQFREEKMEQGRKIPGKYRSIPLSSAEYGIIGRLDALEEKDGKRYPVENKNSKYNDSLAHRVQLCCYAILLEENFNEEVEFGYLYYAESNKRKQVFFTDELRQKTVDVIEKVKRLWEDGESPLPANDERCEGCSLSEDCMPKETTFINEYQQLGNGGVWVADKPNRILCVDTEGAVLKKSGGQIKIFKEGVLIKDVPINAVDQVEISSNVAVTAQMLVSFLDNDIPVYISRQGGELKGHVQPVCNKNILMRVKQVRMYDDESAKLNIAKEFVQGKAKNMRTLLMRYKREAGAEVAEAVQKIEIMIKKTVEAGSLDELRGLEGYATRQYFTLFKVLLPQSTGFDFKTRNRRPPRDPVNSLLSFTYALLQKHCISALAKAGLDPYIGFLHEIVYGRPSLSLDLMEEFRPIVADSVVLTVLNNKMIKESDFIFDDVRCELKEDARKAFFKAFRHRMQEEIRHPLFKYALPYHRIIDVQARLLGKYVSGGVKRYVAFTVR